jgi:hypothetical protein
MRKFIKQINSYNFVYPNNTIAEYGDEIIHDLKENSVSGTVTNFTGTSISSTGLTFSFNYTWALNGAEPWINEAAELYLFSVHMMEPSKVYFKPWRLIDEKYLITTGSTTSSGSYTFSVTPGQMGISAFSNGDYYFEIRMIGHRAIQPLCQTYTISTIVGPTPTPSPSPIPPSPTPTPTATPIPLNFQSGATLNVTDPGYIKYTSPTGSTYEFISSIGTYTITGCAICNTIAPGVPFADLAVFTISTCGNSCGTAPAPTPQPSVTLVYYKLFNCQTFTNYWSQAYPSGTFNSGDRVEGSSGYYYTISGSQTSNPGGTLYTVTRVTGQYGCP